MRKISGALFMLFFITNAYTQSINQSNVPAVILNTFHIRLPNAKEVKWKIEKGFYVVECKANSKYNMLRIDHKGMIREHHQDLYISEIPEKVIETIRSKTSYFDVHDADRFEREGVISYEIKYKTEGLYTYFWLNEKGELLKYRKELKENEIPVSIIRSIHDRFGPMEYDRGKYVEEKGKAVYIIRGEINQADYAFRISEAGNLLIYSKNLDSSELPSKVLDAAHEMFKGFEIQDANLIEKKGQLSYQLRLRKSNEYATVFFSPDGKLLDER